MLFIRFTIRRILRHWRLYLFLLIGMSLVSGLLAGLPIYSKTITYLSLRKSIEAGHPVERNIEVVGPPSVLTGGMLRYVNEIIGDLLSERMEIRTINLGVHIQDPIIPIDSSNRIPPNNIIVWSIDKLRNYSILIEGDWPEFKLPQTREEIQRAMTKPPDIEAVVGISAAQELGIKVGDIVVDNSGRHFPIVGIIKPENPKDDLWWGNMTTFDIYRKPGLNEDTIILSLIIHQSSLREFYPIHELSWRILVNHEMFNPENIISIEQKILNFKSKITAENVSLQTNLLNILQKYREDITTTRMVVFILSTQALVFILYGIFLIESLILGRAESEFATMVGRGSNPKQLMIVMGTEGLIIAIIAGAITGPLLVSSLLLAWSKLSGWYLDSLISWFSIVLSMIGAGIGWLILLFSTLSISRRNIVSWQLGQSRLDEKKSWQKYYIDIFLIFISFIAYWQLCNTGSFVMQRLGETNLADPILLIFPTLFIISISLLYLRIFPYVLRIISRTVHPIRGIIIPLSINKLSRDPQRPSQIILLISIATSATLFSNSYDYSLLINQKSISHYISGADIRIAQKDLSLNDVARLDGILNVTRVFRHLTQLRTGRTLTVLGIDAAEISNVTSYPPGMTKITLDAIANVLGQAIILQPHDLTELSNGDSSLNSPLEISRTENLLPAIFSYSAIPGNIGIGDQQKITILTTPINFVVRGLIKNFPTGGNSYVLTDLEKLVENLDLERSEFYADFELWLSIDPEKYSEIISIPFIQENLLSDVQEEFRLVGNNAFIQGAIGAFILNTFILSVLSILIFTLLIYSSINYRKYEVGVLQVTGLSPSQLLRIFLMEGLIIIIIGISLGTIIGFGLLNLMRPYLNIVLMRSFPQMVVYQLVFDWEQIILGYGLLFLTYLISLSIATWRLNQVGIHQIIRIGDE